MNSVIERMANKLNSMWGLAILLGLLIVIPVVYFTYDEINQQDKIRNMNCLELQKWINSQNPSPDSAYILAQHRFNWMGCEIQKL